MPKQINQFFSAMLIATFFVSLFLFSPQTAKACPPPLQATLLSLYLKSDLIILANFENERIVKKTNESKHGFYANIERDLKISKVYKGNSELENAIYETYEFKPVNQPKTKRRVRRSHLFGYGASIPVKIGDEYLFFLRTSSKGKYALSDFMGGIKYSDENLSVYEENFKELDAIIRNKDNQIENITEWIVKSLDEPVTRWGAIQDIYNSSNVLIYEKTSKRKNNTTFALDKTYNPYTSVIAKNLNDSHKARLSSLLSEEIQNSWFGQKEKQVDYRIPRIVQNWDRTGMMTEAFSILQGFDDSQLSKKLMVMNYMANVIEDKELRKKYYNYSRLRPSKNPKIEANNLLLRTELFNQFSSRFQILLAQNFKPEIQNAVDVSND